MTKTAAIIEARMTSSRLPGKVLMTAVGKPMLEHMVERVRRAASLDEVIIATTTNVEDNPIVDLAASLGVGCYRGSEHNVLSRVLETAQQHGVDVIVELPGDCPLIDPAYIDLCVARYREADVDYASCALSNTFPVGTEAQVFSTQVLADVAHRTSEPDDLEHVSLYIYRNPDIYSLLPVSAPEAVARPEVHLTLDEKADYALIREVFETLYPNEPAFGLDQILDFLDRHPKVRDGNTHIGRKVV